MHENLMFYGLCTKIWSTLQIILLELLFVNKKELNNLMGCVSFLVFKLLVIQLWFASSFADKYPLVMW
jgi:hypothetical protein